MGQILQNWRVLAATLFSAILVVGAYMLARGVESPPIAQASAETALLQAIAAKDSDGDGLPDWEEALYGTDPHITDTFHLGMTDGEAVAKGLIIPKAIADISVATSTPTTNSDINYATAGLTPPTENTLTDAFAKNFLTLYVAAKQANGGAVLTDAETQNIASEALTELSSAITTAPDYKSASDLVVVGSGADALTAFAVSAEAVFKKNTTNATTSELNYLTNAIQNSDATALSQLAQIAKATRNIAVGLAVLPVPQELADGDLALINGMMRISETVADFAHVNVDPLTAMVALQQYLPAAQALGESFVNVSNVYATAGVVLSKNTPGAWFANIASIGRQQKNP
jgi:hypothetical protein